MHAEDDFAPEPEKITTRGGVIFNPWVNISASLILTVGLGWMTVWFWGLWNDVRDAPAYEDQGLDAAAGLIGMIFGGLATIALFAVTIGVIVWWAKRGAFKRRG